MKLTDNFTLEAFERSATAAARGIDNRVPDTLLDNVRSLATRLEEVRTILGDNPIFISSGYRCPVLNSAVGGSPSSAHMPGLAADFTCPAFGTPVDIMVALASSDIAFDQLIEEGTWVHISFDQRMRRQVMRATFDATGKPRYSRVAS